MKVSQRGGGEGQWGPASQGDPVVPGSLQKIGQAAVWWARAGLPPSSHSYEAHPHWELGRGQGCSWGLTVAGSRVASYVGVGAVTSLTAYRMACFIQVVIVPQLHPSYNYLPPGLLIHL